jgi:hypothetical protein
MFERKKGQNLKVAAFTASRGLFPDSKTVDVLISAWQHLRPCSFFETWPSNFAPESS